MLKKIQTLILLCAALIGSGLSLGKTYQNPELLVQEQANAVLHELQAKHQTLVENEKAAYALMERLIKPYIDFEEIGMWLAGKKLWLASSRQDKDIFIKEFSVLLLNTYRSALLKSNSARLEVLPSKQNMAQNRIQISGRIIRLGQETVKIDFRLIKKQDAWYFYDVIAEGVSVLHGFQAQFSENLRKDGLLKTATMIRQHNVQKK